MNIFIFENSSFSNNSLKDFLYYLKYMGQRGVIDFSYANETDSMHLNLSIKENLILDSVPTSLIKDNEVNLSEFINNIKNPDLVKLLSQLGDLNRQVSSLCPRFLKLTSLVKALLSKREMIFLVDPHKNLIKEDIVLLKRCLFFESIENHRKVYIQSIDTNCWLDVANKIITRDEYLNFEEKSNPFLETPRFDNLKLVA